MVGTVWSCPGDHYSCELPCRCESGSCELSLSWNAGQPGYGNAWPVVQSRGGPDGQGRAGLGGNGRVGSVREREVGFAEAVRFKMVMDCGAPEKQKGVSR